MAGRKFWLTVTGLTLLADIALIAVVWELHDSRTHQLFGDLVSRVERSDSAIALTFDDGPTAGFTDEVLDILAGTGTRATFFVIGSDVERHPEEARALVAAGHELGNHSWSHRPLVLRTPETVWQEIVRTDSLIRAVGHTGPIHFRPPYGKKLVVLPWLLDALDRTTVMWDVEPESDPDVASDAARIRDHVLENVAPGSIILLHPFFEARRPTLDALPGLIRDLRSRGYRFVTVSELISDANG